jgi:hypothetical protein
MKLKDLLPDACYGSIATITGEESIHKVQTFLNMNADFINSFKNILVALNTGEKADSYIEEAYKNEWLKMVPNVVFLHAHDNKGHMFGTIELEELILRFAKTYFPKTRYLFKTMEDVITNSKLLELEVPEASFYYLPSISYESIIRNKLDLPQTTFYILDITYIDSLYGKDVKLKHHEYLLALANNPRLKPWDMPFEIKFDCETHLARTVKNHSKYCLLNSETYDKLLNFVEKHKVGDPSHKNIYFINEGICHYHNWEDSVFEL